MTENGTEKETLLTLRRATTLLAAYSLFCVLVLAQPDSLIFRSGAPETGGANLASPIHDQAGRTEGEADENRTSDAWIQSAESQYSPSPLMRPLASEFGLVTIPFAGIQVNFPGFLFIGPLILIAIWAYLQIFLGFSLVQRTSKQPIHILGTIEGIVPQTLSWSIHYASTPILLGVFFVRSFYLGSVFWLYHGVLIVLISGALLLLSIRRGRMIKRVSAGSPFSARNTKPTIFIFLPTVITPIAVLAMIAPPLEMHRLDLRGSELSARDLRGQSLYGARMTGVNLSGAALAGADLRMVDLRGANLHGANLRGVDLKESRLADGSGTGLAIAEIYARSEIVDEVERYPADFRGSDLSGADLRGSVAGGIMDTRGEIALEENPDVDSRTIITYGEFPVGDFWLGANFQDAIMIDANLSGNNLAGGRFSRTDLRGSNLNDTSLQGATLKDADLRFAELRRANLQFADLSNANLFGADISGANLLDVEGVTQSQLDRTCYYETPPILPEKLAPPPPCSRPWTSPNDASFLESDLDSSRRQGRPNAEQDSTQ